MIVRLTLTIDVGDTPRADSDSYQIYQWGSSEPLYGDLDHIEATLLDIVEGTISDAPLETIESWRVVDSYIQEV